jgi:hypothetical protein
MATVTVSSLMSRVGTLLQDAGNIRWNSTELLDWLNDGQREVVMLRPEAGAANEPKALVAGTKQSIPDVGIQFLDAIRNTNGRAVRIVSREILDAQRPDWHSDTPSTTIQHFTYDPRDPKRFYVYPPAASGASLDIVYSRTPTALTLNGTIAIDDIYANTLVDYALYRAYSKDAEYAGNAQKAVAYYTAFANGLGVMLKNEMERNPNLSAGGFNPNVPGAARV